MTSDDSRNGEIRSIQRSVQRSPQALHVSKVNVNMRILQKRADIFDTLQRCARKVERRPPEPIPTINIAIRRGGWIVIHSSGTVP